MTVRYAVTYEFSERPPLTFRSTVTAGQAHVCAARAIKAARLALKPVNWTSLSIVLLERLAEEAEAVA